MNFYEVIGHNVLISDRTQAESHGYDGTQTGFSATYFSLGTHEEARVFTGFVQPLVIAEDCEILSSAKEKLCNTRLSEPL